MRGAGVRKRRGGGGGEGGLSPEGDTGMFPKMEKGTVRKSKA